MSKVVIVTGAARGLGRAIVDAICCQGDVVVIGVDLESGEEALKDLKAKYRDGFEYVTGDVTNDDVLNRVVDLVKHKYDRLDAVVANAGIYYPLGSTLDFQPDQWKRLFDVNFFSNVSLASKTIPLLKKTNGTLIFTSSFSSVHNYTMMGAYSASKAAVNMLAATIAAEFPAIRVAALGPGRVYTRLLKESLGTLTDLKKSGKMDGVPYNHFKGGRQTVEPEIPARVFARLALEGVPASVNGKYMEYDDPRLNMLKAKL